MSLRLLALTATLAALSGPALAADAAAPADAGPLSTASQTTDQKIADWLGDKAPGDAAKPARDHSDDPRRDPGDGQGDRKIHGEIGAGIGTGGYRSAYGVATIPIGKTSSATVAVSINHGGYPWVAGAPWTIGPAGGGVRADCVCSEAPDGSEQCRVGRAASRLDADIAEGACSGPR